MQSLASLMSLKQSDIGNLDDFNDSDEEEGERRVSIGAGVGPATAVTGSGLDTNDKSSALAFQDRVKTEKNVYETETLKMLWS